MPRWIQNHLFSLIFGLIGAIFLLVGLVILWFGLLGNRQIKVVESRPLLNSTELGQTEPGTKAVIEGKISERNPLDADYQIQNAPDIRQTTETLVESRTIRYEGFRIGSPVFADGTVAQPGTEAATFNAGLLYGGNRAAYLANQREANEILFFLGLIFSLVGAVFVTIALMAGLVWRV